jgi:hypothetical protein
MRLLITTLAAIALVAPASLSEAACNPCRVKNRTAQPGWGLRPLASARQTSLRAVIDRRFAARAKRHARTHRLRRKTCGSYKGRPCCVHHVWIKAVGRLKVSPTKTYELLASRFSLQQRRGAQLPQHGRDELWVFGPKATTPTTVLRIGAPGVSGSSGYALPFACNGRGARKARALCAVVWESGQGAAGTFGLRIVRLDGRRFRTVAKAPPRVAKLIAETVTDVHPARCGKQRCLCLIARDVREGDPYIGTSPHRWIPFGVSGRGFGRCR